LSEEWSEDQEIVFDGERDTIEIIIEFGSVNIMGRKLRGHIVALMQKVDKPE